MGNTPQPGSAAAFPPPPGLKTLWELKIVYKLIMAKQLGSYQLQFRPLKSTGDDSKMFTIDLPFF